MSLNLALSSPTGNEPASIQWTLTYPSSDILAITVASGPAATAAGKSIACGGGGGSYMCLLTGINANVIPNGVVAVVSVTVSSAAVSPTISIANPLGASLSGSGIPMTGTGGTITVIAAQPMSLHALTCNPSTLKTPTTSVCTVTLNQTASSNTSVWLSDDSAALMIPASIAVSAGSSSATFTAAASTVTVTENAVITAALDTSTRTASLTLSPPLTLSSLVCNPSSLVSGSTSTCTITLNQTAPSTVNVSLSNNSAALTLPASVTVSAGSSSAIFTITAGTVIATESTVITATFGGSSVNATLSLGNGLVAAFGFDEGKGTMVNDMSGSGNAGIIKGATWTMAGRFGQALSFDGTNDWVAVNDSESLDLTTGMTLEAWVNPKTLGTFWRTVVFKELPGGLAYSLYANSGSNKRPSGYIRLNGGEQDSGTEGTAVVPANTWTHLATTYDGTTLRLFVNGVLVRSTTATGAIRTSTGVLRIGGNAVSSKDYFKGLIDEVRIYNRPLSQAEIQNDMVTAVSTLSTPAADTTLVSSTMITSEIQAPLLTESAAEQNTILFSEPKSAVSALSCSPRIVRAGAEVGCGLQVSESFTPLQIRLTSSSEYVKIPAVIATRPHQSRLMFHAFVEPLAKQQSVIVTATLGDTQVQDTIVVMTPGGPVLTIPDTQIVKFGQLVDFSISAADPSDLAVQLAVAGLPVGASFDAAGGRFSWIPNTSQAGKHKITFTAYNSALQSSTAHLIIDVDSGMPVLTPSKQFLCSPNSIARVTGKWLAASRSVFSDPTGRAMDLDGTKVRVNGQYVPVLFSSATEVTFLCPDLRPGAELSVEVETASAITEPVTTIMREASPTIISLDGSGMNQGVVSFADGKDLVMARTFRAPGHPAQTGDHIVIWATGLASVAEASNRAVRVKVGDIYTDIESIHAVSGYAGLYNVQVRVPAVMTVGDVVPLQLEVTTPNGQQFNSNTVTISIEQGSK